MRVAVIAQQTSLGGGTRFLKPLLKAMADTYEDVSITVLANAAMDRTVDPFQDFSHPRITVEHLAMPIYEGKQDEPGVRFALRKAAAWLRGRRPHQLNPARRKALHERVQDFDVVYLAWPYFLDTIDIDRPLVATFHDFNYKHAYGTINAEVAAALDQEVPLWIAKCNVSVTSSEFIMDELRKYYSVDGAATRVIPLSTFVTHFPSADEIDAARLRYGLPETYVICPGHALPPHKNVSTMLRAYSKVRGAGGPPLVLIGGGTQLLSDPAALNAMAGQAENTGHILEALAASELRFGEDFFGLGFIPDADADALIAGAKLCIAPSLYEAGSGSGVDAWSLGTPMCMSDITPFREHLHVLRVDAELFDPLDVSSMSAVISDLLTDEDRMAAMVDESLRAMRKYTWVDVATAYHEAFIAAIRDTEVGDEFVS